MQARELEQMGLVALTALAKELGVVVTDQPQEALIAEVRARMDTAPMTPVHDPATPPPASLPPVSAGNNKAELFPLRPTADLPQGYDTTQVVVMAQKPHHFYAYWEVREVDLQAARAKAGDLARMVLRIEAVDRGDTVEIQVHDRIGEWFFHLEERWDAVRVQLGLLGPDGSFVLLAESATITTPADGPSHRVDPEWAVRDETFASILALSGGMPAAAGSAQMAHLPWQGWVPSSPGGSANRPV